MTAKTKDEIKAFFQTGDRPTEAQFIDLIDSYIDKDGPLGDIETLASGMSIGVASFAGGAGSIMPFATLRDNINVSALYATTALGNAGDTGATIMTPVVTRNAIETFAFTSADYATTAQAAAGTNAATVMNPRLTKAAIDAFGSVPTGGVVNTISYDYTTNGPAGTTAMPIDDVAAPQITEGNQVFNQSYTMSSATNKLRVEFRGFLTGTAATTMAALFVNGASDAVRCALTGPGSVSVPAPIYLVYEFTPGTVAAQLYEIRIGNNGGSAVRLNGTTTSRIGGGTAAATLTFTEIKA